MVVKKIMATIKISGEEIREVNGVETNSGEEISNRINSGVEINHRTNGEEINRKTNGVEISLNGAEIKILTISGEEISLKTNGEVTSLIKFKAINGADKCKEIKNGATTAKS